MGKKRSKKGEGVLWLAHTSPPEPDIRIRLSGDVFTKEDARELEEQLRAETGLRVEAGTFGNCSGGEPFPPDVILDILHKLFPLKEVHVNALAPVLADKVRAARARYPGTRSAAVFEVYNWGEDGMMLKEVSGSATDPEIIKDVIRRAGEAGKVDIPRLLL